jgi:hypothetical protein
MADAIIAIYLLYLAIVIVLFFGAALLGASVGAWMGQRSPKPRLLGCLWGSLAVTIIAALIAGVGRAILARTWPLVATLTYRELLLGIGIVAVALGALLTLTIALGIRTPERRERNSRWLWISVVSRGVLTAGLIGIAVVSLSHLPAPQMTNHPAPAPANHTVVYTLRAQGDWRTVIGASARNGETRWRRAFPEDVLFVLQPQPNLTLVVASAPYTGIGNTARSVYALRSSDGAVAWHITESWPVWSYWPHAVATDGQRLFDSVASTPASGGVSTTIVAYDLLTGAQVWRSQPLLNTSQEILCASDGFVFLANATSVPGQANNGPTNIAFNVLALDAATGAQHWSRAFASGTLSSTSPPVTFKSLYSAAETIVVVTSDSVYAFGERDGANIWQKTLATPALPHDEVIFDAAMDANSLYLLTNDLGPASDTPTTLTRGGAPVASDTLLALDTRTGAQRWRAEINVADQLQSTWRGDIWTNSPTMALSGGALLVGSLVPPGFGWNLNHQPQTTSGLVAYDTTTGHSLWADDAMRTGVAWNLTPLSSPLTADGAVYLLGAGANPYPAEFSLFSTGALWLYAVNMHTGAAWWRVRVA